MNIYAIGFLIVACLIVAICCVVVEISWRRDAKRLEREGGAWSFKRVQRMQRQRRQRLPRWLWLWR